MTEPNPPVVKNGAPWWAVILVGLIATAALVWCIIMSGRVSDLERHNRELVEWGREVQAWSANVTRAIWGPGGDPCCTPPNPPPELE